MRGLVSVRHNLSRTGALYKRIVTTMTSCITSNLEAVNYLQRIKASNLEAVNYLQRIKEEGNRSFRQKRLLEAAVRYEDVQHACVWLLPHLKVSSSKGDDLTPRAKQLKSILIDASLNWCFCVNQITADYANDLTSSHQVPGVGFNLLNQTREFLTTMTEGKRTLSLRVDPDNQQEMCWRGDAKLLKMISLERGLLLLPLMQIRPEEGKSEELNDRTLFSYPPQPS